MLYVPWEGSIVRREFPGGGEALTDVTWIYEAEV